MRIKLYLTFIVKFSHALDDIYLLDVVADIQC